MKKMYRYKGFVIEPILGSYNVVLYGKRNTLYVKGPGGMQFTDDMREARAFRSTDFCERLIDECVKDHAEWVSTLDAKPISNLSGVKNLADLMSRAQERQQQQQNSSSEEQVRQQQQQQSLL